MSETSETTLQVAFSKDGEIKTFLADEVREAERCLIALRDGDAVAHLPYRYAVYAIDTTVDVDD